MNRALVFVLVGPALVALEVWMVMALVLGIPGVFVGYLVSLLFVLALPVSAIAGLLDSCLARSLPALLRAPLTAAISMTISVVFVLALLSRVETTLSSVANHVIGAGLFLLLPMGVCSLLSNDWDNRRRPAVVQPDYEERPV
jgi:hypothetical protein